MSESGLALSAALIRRVLPELSKDLPRTEGLRTWIETGSFYVARGRTPDAIVLENINLAELLPFVSFDYERFALSSLESLLSCQSEQSSGKAIGWSAAKLYYSAFFGAHAIMRSTGWAVSRIEPAQAARISKLASLYVPETKLGSGTYNSRLVQTQSMSIDLHLIRQPDTGGAHEQFWKSFYAFLGEIAADVSSHNEPEAIAVVAEISQIQEVLASSGMNGGTWLSSMRNQFTYQHRFGVWFPFHKSNSDAVNYMRRIGLRHSGSIRRDYNCAKTPLLAFFAACHLIATINYELGTAICYRNNAPRFQQLWQRLETEGLTNGYVDPGEAVPPRTKGRRNSTVLMPVPNTTD